jgi:hypothetical protein
MSVVVRVGRPGLVTRWAYRCRHEPLPVACSREPLSNALALTVPYRWRRFHHRYAALAGYFWLPCRVCGREHGGHEAATVGDDTACRRCSRQAHR